MEWPVLGAVLESGRVLIEISDGWLNVVVFDIGCKESRVDIE